MARLKVLLHGSEIQDLELIEGQEYVAGRSEGCDLQLDDHPGISRQHFKISFDGQNWTVSLLSKFGSVLHNGRATGEVTLGDGIGFELPPYSFLFKESAPEQYEDAHENADAEIIEDSPAPSGKELAPYMGAVRGGLPAPAVAEVESFSGSEDSTYVGSLGGKPYIRITSDGGRQEKVFRLEGTCWLAGRDENCEIPLADMKASRRQFEIASQPNGTYTITDLGSANGTIVNGSAITPNKPLALRSGDVISVNSLVLTFEIRDPSFKDKLNNIPDTIKHHPALIADPTGGMVAMPPLQGPGGVIRIDPNAQHGYYGGSAPKPTGLKNPRTRMMAAAVVLLVIVAALMSEPEAPQTTAPQESPAVLAFRKLTAEQQQFIKDTYVLAQNLVIQQKWELALSQVEKIHGLLPEGYEDSKEIEQTCKQYFDTKQQHEFVKKQMEKEKEARAKVAQIIANCEKVAARSENVSEIKTCIAPALEIDPSNERLSIMVSQVEQRVQERQRREAEKAEYQSLLRQRASLCARADAIKREGKLLEAIEAHRRCINSSLPDPNGLESKAEREIAAIRQTIDSEVQKYIDEAERLYQAGTLKDADLVTRKALRIDPNNAKVTEQQGKIRRELTAQVKAMYADSVLEESLGNIDAAKEKWKKIVELDREDGDYFIRAKRKLRQYGSL